MTTTHEKPTPAPVEVTQADRMLVEAIINDYHTTRLDSDYVSHILSKPRTQSALARHRIAHPAPPADQVELVEALRRMTRCYTELVYSGDCGSWDAELEPAVTAAYAALAKHTRAQGEG